MKTGQLNVKIDAELINQVKAKAYSNGLKLYEFVDSALREKIDQKQNEKDKT